MLFFQDVVQERGLASTCLIVVFQPKKQGIGKKKRQNYKLYLPDIPVMVQKSQGQPPVMVLKLCK